MIGRLRLLRSGRIFHLWDVDGVVGSVVVEEDLEDVVGIVVDLELVEGGIVPTDPSRELKRILCEGSTFFRIIFIKGGIE
jgi:hypothetical protein